MEQRCGVQVLEKKWFANRRCLDLGCNAGILTLSVVQQFLPAKMVGVDIDEDLTKMASQSAPLHLNSFVSSSLFFVFSST